MNSGDAGFEFLVFFFSSCDLATFFSRLQNSPYFAYSSKREQSNKRCGTHKTLTPRVTDFFTDFEEKTDCFAVYFFSKMEDSLVRLSHLT